ncbi:serine hydrolase [Sphingosinicella sp. BN140058]|uniref:serine hydrolase domain-containing protein n=1 Tax=Sphingosinicella sp. BN140058 TaxID=1892855 RepID=UPI0010124BC2|nr:serine hydrolase domain-containing protein [Sphingosinicella sp. BN140058]QAY75942.1 class A beta-lactamase-related serine hydrolase [Sphingosinicella sp. BN140058]
MRLLAFAVPFMLLCSAAQAAPGASEIDRGRVETEADAALASMVDPAGSGAAVLIAQGEAILYRNAHGMADVALGVPLTPDHVFRIASITKTFTAGLIVHMVERGELSLDAPAGDYLPDLGLDRRITVRQLLSHTAGIADTDVPPLPPFGPGEIQIEAQLRRIAARPLLFVPGGDQRYSNAGYVLLGGIIERRSGQRWEAALQDRLFRPLSLLHTGYADAATIVPGRVAGYSGEPGALRNADPGNVSGPKTAGALHSTLDDLRTWFSALAHGQVVRAPYFAAMTTPARASAAVQDRYGLGLALWRVRGEEVIGHTGQIGGGASALIHIPSRDTVIAVLANNDSFDAQTLARRLAAIVIGRPYPIARPALLSAESLASLAGTYGDDARNRRTLAVTGHALTLVRPDRPPIPMIVDGDGKLRFVTDDLSYFEPIRDRRGHVVRLDLYSRGEGPPVAYPRQVLRGDTAVDR